MLDVFFVVLIALQVVWVIPRSRRWLHDVLRWSPLSRQSVRADDMKLVKSPLHRIVVPPGPDGRPGEVLLATSTSPYIGVIASDGSRNDCSILLSHRGSVCQVVCLGPTAERGDMWQSTIFTLNKLSGKGSARPVGQPYATTMAGLPAVRSEIIIGIRHLTDWKFEYRGWLFVAGFLLYPGDDAAVIEARALAVLSTWHWLDPVPYGLTA